MPVATETSLIEVWLDGRLKNDTTLQTYIGASPNQRVLNDVTVQGTIYPFIVYELQSDGHEVRGVGTSRIMVDTIYSVKAISIASDFSGLAPIAARIDELITVGGHIPVPVTGGVIQSRVREAVIQTNEIIDGRQHRGLGGLFRIYAQAT